MRLTIYFLFAVLICLVVIIKAKTPVRGVTGVYKWAPWSKCSKSCGGGTRTRVGTCSASKCKGSSKKTKSCKTKKCEGAHKEVSSGTCIGVSEAECQEIASQQNYEFKPGNTNKSPPGCYVKKQQGDMYFNTKASSTKACSAKRTCLCHEEPCLLNAVNYAGHNVKEIHDVVSWRACRALCQKTEECHAWSYDKENYKFARNRKKCALKDETYYQGKKTLLNVISGMKRCEADCKDDEPDCPYWAKTRQCTENASYMSKHCKLSCGECYVNECGKQSLVPDAPGISRVVGGNTAEVGEWPWQVGLWHVPRPGRGRELSPFCGGTLISPNVVVTAAHCFPKTQKPEDHFVRVGDLNLASKGEQEERVAVKEIIIHDDFNEVTYVNDIALIILNKKLTLKKEVNAACLPRSNEALSYCFVTGWGRLAEKGEQAVALQKVNLPIVATDTCNKAYQKIFKKKRTFITNNMLCAGYKNGAKDSCGGDSGGPLVCLKNDRYILRGIVSWGKGCARVQSYGVYTNTFKYMDWIRQKGKL